MQYLFPTLPKTGAPWPVWHDSTPAASFRWVPSLSRRAARRLYEKARAYERRTGKLMLGGLAVFYALLFDFLNYSTGRLDPSGAAIAKKAAVDVATVWRAIKRLVAAGFLSRERRCVDGWEDGRYFRRQLTNAYRPLDPEPDQEPLPEPGTWGDHPFALDPLFAESKGDLGARVAILEAEGGGLAGALARLGRAMRAGKP